MSADYMRMIWKIRATAPTIGQVESHPRIETMSANPDGQGLPAFILTKLTSAECDIVFKWKNDAVAKAPAPTSGKVFLVATGIIQDGRETYTRWDDRPPLLCDFECLFTHPPAPTSGNEEVEAMWAKLVSLAERESYVAHSMDMAPERTANWQHAIDLQEAAVLLRKQAAQIAELAALTVARAEDIQARDAQIAELQKDVASRQHQLEIIAMERAELQRLLRACLDDEFGVGSKALIKEIEAAIAKESDK